MREAFGMHSDDGGSIAQPRSGNDIIQTYRTDTSYFTLVIVIYGVSLEITEPSLKRFLYQYIFLYYTSVIVC